MTIYVDKLKRHRNKPIQGPAQNWACRMFTDPTEDLSGLIQFAESIGVPMSSLHETVMPHFDIGFPKRCDAVSRSAVEVDECRAQDIEASWRRFWREQSS